MSDNYYTTDNLPEWYKKPTETNTLNKGWICPKCGAVMSPYTSSCIYCIPSYTKPYIVYCNKPSISDYPNGTIYCNLF